ncbi:MAG: hypothetical protein AABN95_25230 [Acidobacteriota bacterium]
MLMRVISLRLVALLFHAARAMPILAAGQASHRESPVARVKADVARRGVGKKARVTVKLQWKKAERVHHPAIRESIV